MELLYSKYDKENKRMVLETYKENEILYKGTMSWKDIIELSIDGTMTLLDNKNNYSELLKNKK